MKKIIDITLGLTQIVLLFIMFLFLVYNTILFVFTHNSFFMFAILSVSIFVATKLLINIIKDFVTRYTED